MRASRQISRVLFLLVAVFPWIVSPARGQFETPVTCPQVVLPEWVAYPFGRVPYRTENDSGIFHVNFLLDPYYFSWGPRAQVTYVPRPAPPYDVANPIKVWTNAALDAYCILVYVPHILNYTTLVLETAKHGNIAYLGSNDSCDGQGDNTITGQFYEVIDLSTGSTAHCGSGEDSQVPGGSSMCSDLQLTPGCYAVYVDGVFRGNVCC